MGPGEYELYTYCNGEKVRLGTVAFDIDNNINVADITRLLYVETEDGERKIMEVGNTPLRIEGR